MPAVERRVPVQMPAKRGVATPMPEPIAGRKVVWEQLAEGSPDTAQAAEAMSGREAALRRLVEGEELPTGVGMGGESVKKLSNRTEGNDGLSDRINDLLPEEGKIELNNEYNIIRAYKDIDVEKIPIKYRADPR